MTPMHLVSDGTDFWKYLMDWRTTDFYRYNPVDDSSFMDYERYRQGRMNGTLPAPDPAVVHHNTIYPLHFERDGA